MRKGIENHLFCFRRSLALEPDETTPQSRSKVSSHNSFSSKSKPPPYPKPRDDNKALLKALSLSPGKSASGKHKTFPPDRPFSSSER